VLHALPQRDGWSGGAFSTSHFRTASCVLIPARALVQREAPHAILRMSRQIIRRFADTGAPKREAALKKIQHRAKSEKEECVRIALPGALRKFQHVPVAMWPHWAHALRARILPRVRGVCAFSSQLAQYRQSPPPGSIKAGGSATSGHSGSSGAGRPSRHVRREVASLATSVVYSRSSHQPIFDTAPPMDSTHDDALDIVVFCCGVGGFCAGATRAGHRVRLAIDCDCTALRVHSTNLPACANRRWDLPVPVWKLARELKRLNISRWHAHLSASCTTFSPGQTTKERRRTAATRR
jgi:hypothetical protein